MLFFLKGGSTDFLLINFLLLDPFKGFLIHLCTPVILGDCGNESMIINQVLEIY